jgi:hypothetical protein
MKNKIKIRIPIEGYFFFYSAKEIEVDCEDNDKPKIIYEVLRRLGVKKVLVDLNAEPEDLFAWSYVRLNSQIMKREITNEELNNDFKKFGLTFMNYKTIVTSLDVLYHFLLAVCKYDTLLIARRSSLLRKSIKREEDVKITVTHDPIIYIESTPTNLAKISQILNEILTGVPPPSERDAKGLKRWVFKNKKD